MPWNSWLRRNPELRTLLTAAVIGAVIGGAAALGWAKVTPVSVGFFTFAGIIIGTRVRR